jgi:hypothetical protein
VGVDHHRLFTQLDQAIDAAEPDQLPGLVLALSARLTVATTRLLANSTATTSRRTAWRSRPQSQCREAACGSGLPRLVLQPGVYPTLSDWPRLLLRPGPERAN